MTVVDTCINICAIAITVVVVVLAFWAVLKLLKNLL